MLWYHGWYFREFKWTDNHDDYNDKDSSGYNYDDKNNDNDISKDNNKDNNSDDDDYDKNWW